MGAGGVLSKETGAGVGLVVGRILSNEADDGVGTDAWLGWALVVALTVDGGQRSGTVTREGGVLLKSTGLEVSVGLERAADTEPEVVVDVVTVDILEGITSDGEEGLVTVQAGDTVDAVTGALDSPAAELTEGLKEVGVWRFKLLAESNLGGGGWVKVTGVRGLCVPGGGLADVDGGVAKGLGLLIESITG